MTLVLWSTVLQSIHGPISSCNASALRGIRTPVNRIRSPTPCPVEPSGRTHGVGGNEPHRKGVEESSRLPLLHLPSALLAGDLSARAPRELHLGGPLPTARGCGVSVCQVDDRRAAGALVHRRRWDVNHVIDSVSGVFGSRSIIQRPHRRSKKQARPPPEVAARGIEPPTCGLEGSCSIRLRYRGNCFGARWRPRYRANPSCTCIDTPRGLIQGFTAPFGRRVVIITEAWHRRRSPPGGRSICTNRDGTQEARKRHA